jgi:exosortase
LFSAGGEAILTALTSTSTDKLEYGVGSSDDEPIVFGLRASTFVKVATVAGLFVLLFWPNLRRLWDKTNPFTGEPNWGHATAIPLIGLYYLYIQRANLRAAQVKPAWSGLLIALFGVLFFGWGIYPGQNDLFKDIGMVITLFGVVTLLCGWQVMKIAWFPIVFLFCALPWPGLMYGKIAGPLQQLAASVAVRVLHFFSVEAGQFGTKIFIVGNKNTVRTLNVAEACAGLRSLMTFVSVAAAVAFLSNRAMWQKIILVASAVPIAIFCNVMRVSGQGLLDRYVSPQLSESFAHQFVGLIMLVPAFFLILLVGWILQNIFVEEVDDKAALKAKAATSQKADARIVRRQVTPTAHQTTAPAAQATSPAPIPQKPAAAAAQKPVAPAVQVAAPRPAVAKPPPPARMPPRPSGLAGMRGPAAPRPPAPPQPPASQPPEKP